MFEKQISMASSLLFFFVLLMCIQKPAHALDGVTVTGGYWNESVHRKGVRLAGRWDWERLWFKDSAVQIGGFWDASVAYWTAQHRKPGQKAQLWVVAAGPMFQFRLNGRQDRRWFPFLELGIGASYMTRDELGDRQLGSRGHFEDKIGLGINLREICSLELGYRYMHYSNAGIKGPNDGLDFHTINVTWFFP